MAEFFFGAVLGVIIGVVCMSLLSAASDADDEMMERNNIGNTNAVNEKR